MLPLHQYPKRCHSGLLFPDSGLMFNLEFLSSSSALPKITVIPIFLSLSCLFDPVQFISCVPPKRSFVDSAPVEYWKKKKKCLENLSPGNISHYLYITPENISYKLHPLTPWKSFPPPTPSWNFITAFSSPGIFLAHIHLNEFSLSPNSLKLFPTWENFRNFSRQQNPLVFFSAPTPVFLLFPICPADFSHTQIKLHIYLLHQYLREYFSQQL